MEERSRHRPRIADVAREAGVSKTAVSFAFNSPGRLSPETATRIRDVAESLGYRPNPVARMLTQRQTLSIGILTPQALSVIVSNPYFGAFTEGVAAAAEESGYALHFISPLHGSLARAIGRATVDGVVAVGLSADHPEVEEIRASGLPMVLVDSTAMPDQPSVEVDDEGGACVAAEHLLALGHREFLVIGGEPTPGAHLEPDGVMHRRLRGYLRAFGGANVQLADSAFVVGPATIEGGIAAVRGAWEDGLRPTAVLAMVDAMAIGAMRAARELGVRVPGELSVVGFDDIDLAQHTDPPLTTIHQPIRRKGEEAVQVLLAVVDRRSSHRSEQRRLETRLVVRGSSGPVPRSQEVASTAM